uniref:Uncharacterized protein n=2 Tax=Oryza sativa subsp. japonica TaxID=39947 RepID=Q6ZL14_ORYSJ|nr:unknown protein [Oryza sativa Japonica Group]BAD30225.1 unknown protein [Oryza sativa Japonica Group]
MRDARALAREDPNRQVGNRNAPPPNPRNPTNGQPCAVRLSPSVSPANPTPSPLRKDLEVEALILFRVPKTMAGLRMKALAVAAIAASLVASAAADHAPAPAPVSDAAPAVPLAAASLAAAAFGYLFC